MCTRRIGVCTVEVFGLHPQLQAEQEHALAPELQEHEEWEQAELREHEEPEQAEQEEEEVLEPVEPEDPAERLVWLQAERQAAESMGIPWKLRGPPAPADPHAKWRGQKFRDGSQRWANRGGKRKLEWAEYYKKKGAGKGTTASTAGGPSGAPSSKGGKGGGASSSSSKGSKGRGASGSSGSGLRRQ